ncbi:AFR275Wp [Eremothecium gossypii ATCC 10895]|uniref:RING-type E3 ubiquitin transferase n=1 Tax=Eremothecium gossypii (strain ATCC 10895 / CBS 109.51 / FGSC 9923 / NRRL Y-1056) TaxID=284811 RepID=Q753N7_EREGS|nr:AFR275Wp [Eremothecium gossypii ATCC 10895]AAS53646.1 AFR275Wp [Eremothecium gossypii ATCC 10895]AEY97959.1 FAFR275Wp [Eremothecium gossypii FDAG1]
MDIDGNTFIFVIVIIFILMASPGGDGVTSQYEFNQMEQLKSQFRDEYTSFKNMFSSSNFQNITGFKLSYSDAVQDPERNATYPIDGKSYTTWAPNQEYLLFPDEVRDSVWEHVWRTDDVLETYPPNITATLHGNISLVSNNKYVRVPMPIPLFYQPPTDFAQNQPPSGEYYLRSPDDILRYGLHNVTFDVGKVDLSVRHIDTVSPTWRRNSSKSKRFNSQEDKWKLLRLNMDFADDEEHERHNVHGYGIYDVQRGQIIVMSESAKCHSLFAFPHYMNLREDKARYKSLMKLIDDYWEASDYVNTLTMDDLQNWYRDANQKCEYVGFLQLKPWAQYTKDQIKMIDDELFWPIGRPVNISDIPEIEIEAGELYSPDCGVHLRLGTVAGPRYEVQVRSIRKHLLVGCALFGAQIYLLILQMQHTNTPSSVNKISFWCLAMMNLVDGLLGVSFWVASSLRKDLYLSLLMDAIVCMILSGMFEIRYMISVYASQVNERGISVWTLLRGSNAETNPPPAVIADETTISGSLYTQFIFKQLLCMFLVISSSSWPKNIRTIFEYVCLAILNSYWIPQIYRNAVKGNQPRQRRRGARSENGRNNKMPMLWKFIVGTTIIRTAPVIYVFTYPSNIFRHHRDIRYAVGLSVWLLLQMLILFLQDTFGARWFLPKSAIPEGYSYHKPLNSTCLLEHGANDNYCVSCAICMSELAIHVEDIPETHKANIHDYMVTPCSHLFHTGCLENWMSYKLQCPVCRAPLPPL